MDGIRNAWARLTNSPARLALTAAIALVAVAGGVAFAVAVNGIRQPIGAGSPPSATVAIDLSESEDPSPSPNPHADPLDAEPDGERHPITDGRR